MPYNQHRFEPYLDGTVRWCCPNVIICAFGSRKNDGTDIVVRCVCGGMAENSANGASGSLNLCRIKLYLSKL